MCCAYFDCLGERYCTANVHHLLHFADSVRNLGPLFGYTAFPFEDTNASLAAIAQALASTVQVLSAVQLSGEALI